jgi:chromosome segregation ATPase
MLKVSPNPACIYRCSECGVGVDLTNTTEFIKWNISEAERLAAKFKLDVGIMLENQRKLTEEHNTLKEQLKSDGPSEQEKKEMSQAYRERTAEDLELCNAMRRGPEIRHWKERAESAEVEHDKLKKRCERQEQLLNPRLETTVDIHGLEEQVSELRERAEKADVANEAHIKLNAKLCDELQKSKEEVKTLREQVAGLEELNYGLDYCAEQEEIKRKDAESRLAEAEPSPEMASLILRGLGYISPIPILQPQSEDFKRHIDYLRKKSLRGGGDEK